MNQRPVQISLLDLTATNEAVFEDSGDTETKIRDAMDNLKGKMANGHNLLVATSFGKDSSVLLTIALNALREFKEENGTAPFMICVNSNTLIENPLMDAFARGEAAKVEQFIAKHDLPARMDIVTPNLSSHYYVQMLGGRTVATLPDNGAKCSDMLKAGPITAHKKSVFKEFGAESVITLIGKRRDESAARARSMEASGENAMDAVLDNHGSLVLSAIADFTLDDIFTAIGMVRSERLESYSDFDDLVQVYRDANGGDCMVSIYATGQSSSTGCGARTGCWTCARVQTDTSMENMLEDHEWMRPLNDIRNYIVGQHYNPAKRTWLSRSIADDGTVVIAPNAYSAEHCEDLLRYTLTAQIVEAEAAWDLDIEPRFGILQETDIIAIESLWSRYGYHRSLKACEIFHDIYVKGQRFYPPTDATVYPNSALPQVGTRVQFADLDYDRAFAGFRDLEAAVADCEAVIEKNGKLYTDARTGDVVRVSEEGAAMFFEFELEDALARYADSYVSSTGVFQFLVRFGVLEINKGGHSEVDRMLRMASQIWRLGLRDVLNDPMALVERLEAHFGSGNSSGGNFQQGLFTNAA